MRIVDCPEVGYFKLVLVKNGPVMPAIIYMPCPIDPFFGEFLDRKRKLVGQIGIFYSRAGYETALKIWNSGKNITKAEYEKLMDRVLVAQTTAAPELYPYEPIKQTALLF